MEKEDEFHSEIWRRDLGENVLEFENDFDLGEITHKMHSSTS